jgi:hypothetical protein
MYKAHDFMDMFAVMKINLKPFYELSVCIYMVLGIEYSYSYMLCKCSTTELPLPKIL